MTHPTPYPEINTLLALVIDGAREALGPRFAGAILHGSLAAGDFNPGRSDIDLVIVTEGALPAGDLDALVAMHRHLSESGLPWADRLECSYIPREALRRFDPARMAYPALRCDGSFGVDDHGSDWILQRWVLRERGVALAGPAPAALIDPVTPTNLRRSAEGILREWWLPQITDTHRLHSPEYQAYAALTMCRALYTLAEGAVAPKTAAARWALDGPAQPWRDLVEDALAWRHGAPLDRLHELLALMRFTLARAGVLESDPQ